MAVKKTRKKAKTKNLEDIQCDGWDKLDAMVPWASAEYCAFALGMSRDALKRNIKDKFGMNFKEYKQMRREPFKLDIIAKQFEVGVKDGSVPMLIWLGKNYADQSDKSKTEIEGKLDGFNLNYKLDRE